MRKKIVCVLLAILIMILLLFGCGSGTSSGAAKEAETLLQIMEVQPWMTERESDNRFTGAPPSEPQSLPGCTIDPLEDGSFKLDNAVYELYSDSMQERQHSLLDGYYFVDLSCAEPIAALDDSTLLYRIRGDEDNTLLFSLDPDSYTETGIACYIRKDWQPTREAVVVLVDGKTVGKNDKSYSLALRLYNVLDATEKGPGYGILDGPDTAHEVIIGFREHSGLYFRFRYFLSGNTYYMYIQSQNIMIMVDKEEIITGAGA